MDNLWLVRVFHPDAGVRFGVQESATVYDLTAHFPTLTAWLRRSSGAVADAIEELRQMMPGLSSYPARLFENAPGAGRSHWLAPVDEQDVWAAGVTYERSREARQEEAVDGGDIYARVYEAARPELFFKARGGQVIGQYGAVGVRADANWSVPEPELTLLLNPALEVVGLTAGNDVSSRDIEGENPLYLPQAKVYKASCALGHGVLLGPATGIPDVQITLLIRREGKEVFKGSVSTERIRRSLGDLLGYLGRSQEFPDGVALMTGTGVVPPNDFTLKPGDEVMVDVAGVTRLLNAVRLV